MRCSIPAVALAAAAALACRGREPEEVRAAVQTYLDRVVEAYRTSDASLVGALVSEQQMLKLVGLIGVKRDAGVALDARLLELRFVRTERSGDAWIVETEERWYYRDRRIGSGEQVGEDSTDAYAMRYTFARKSGRWILEDLAFARAPVVGRKTAPTPTDVRVLHGLPPAGERQGGSAASPHGAPDAQERAP